MIGFMKRGASESTRRIDFSLVLPCLNQEKVFTKNITKIVETLKNQKISWEIVFVDDGSSDGTLKLIKKFCKNNSFARAIYHEIHEGHGKAVVDGFLVAKGKVVGYIDLDLEISPVYISECINLILNNQAAMVVGRRISQINLNYFFWDVLGLSYRWLTNKLVDTAGIDTLSDYKFIRRTILKQLLKQAASKDWFWDTEIVINVKRLGFKIVEVPVFFVREAHQQTITELFKRGAQVVQKFWSLRNQ